MAADESFSTGEAAVECSGWPVDRNGSAGYQAGEDLAVKLAGNSVLEGLPASRFV